MTKRVRGAIDEGFTLIELLIVIIILGILAAIVVFAVGNTKKDAVNASCTTDVKSIMLAEEAYKVHLVNGSAQGYATDSATLTSSSSGNLKSWPGSTNMVFTLGGTSTAYTLAISGSDVTGTGTSPLGPSSTDSDINTACAGA